MNEKKPLKKVKKRITKERPFPATVAARISAFQVVINRGENDGVKLGKRFLLYTLSENEINDPETGKSLGFLELPKGTGEIVHVQPSMSTLKSDRRGEPQKIVTKSTYDLFTGILGRSTPTEEKIIPGDPIPFNDPKIGDKARPI